MLTGFIKIYSYSVVSKKIGFAKPPNYLANFSSAAALLGSVVWEELLLMKTTAVVQRVGGVRKKEERYHCLPYQCIFDKNNNDGAKNRGGAGKGVAVPLSTSSGVLPQPHTP